MASSFEWGSLERSRIVRTGVRAVASSAVLITLYYVLPIEHRAHQSVGLRLGAALALFVAVFLYQLQAIVSHSHPMLRAAESLATIIPLFLVLFAWIYLTMSHSTPSAFGSPLDRTSALYFTVTVFSTVGFGDITAKTDVARLVVTVQIVADLAVIAIVVRLLINAGHRGAARQHESMESIPETNTSSDPGSSD